MTDLCLSLVSSRPITNPALSPGENLAKRKGKLLIGTNDVEFGLLLRLAFKTEPYSICETTIKEIAFKLGDDPQFDLVLLDIMTTPIDNASIVQQIRQINQTVRIIVISALNVEKWMDVALANGADGFVVKPFSLTTIRQKVIQLLEKDRLKMNTGTVSSVTPR